MATDPVVVPMPQPPRPAASGADNPFAVLLQLEAETRQAESVKALQFLIVNDTRRVVGYRQAYVLSDRGNTHRADTISSLAVVERNAPAVRWTEQVIDAMAGTQTTETVRFIEADDIPDSLRAAWPDFCFSHAALCRLATPGGHGRAHQLGVLWLSRDKPFTEADATLLERLAVTYGHAWGALTKGRVKSRVRLRRWLLWGLLLLIVGAMFLPLRMSVMAPAEIVATEPTVVAAPLQGVIEEVIAKPNTTVAIGDPLFRFEDIELRNEFAIAERRLDVARAALSQAKSGAFRDPESRAQVAVLEAEVALRQIERDYAQERLARVVVKAEQPGILLYTDPSDWKGRPVNVGERVMEIASPENVHVRVNLPVEDAIVIEPGTEVELFLDTDPLHPYQARLTSGSYTAEKTPQDMLAFHLKAKLIGDQTLPRIGLKGTAKVYGQETTLFMYLFRRPISTLRQYFGF